MADRDLKLVEINKDFVMPKAFRELNEEELRAVLEQAKRDFDPVESEAAFKELLKQREEGKLIPLEEMLKQLDAIKGWREVACEEPDDGRT
jgi:hypothetical protein